MRLMESKVDGSSVQRGSPVAWLVAWLAVTALSPGGLPFTRGKRNQGGRGVKLQCHLCGWTSYYDQAPRQGRRGVWFCSNGHPKTRRRMTSL
jgi:hypothetical protein